MKRKEEFVFGKEISQRTETKLFAEYLLPWAESLPGNLILDAAGGTGVESALLSEHGYRICLTDISPFHRQRVKIAGVEFSRCPLSGFGMDLVSFSRLGVFSTWFCVCMALSHTSSCSASRASCQGLVPKKFYGIQN